MTEKLDVARLQPIPRDQWSPAMVDASKAMSVGAPKRTGPLPPGRPQGGNVTGLFANHPALAKAYFTFNAHILWSTTVTPRQRELLILRVGALRHAPYEFAQHVHLAREAGVTDEEIERVKVGPSAPGWDPLEQTLLTATDELIGDARIRDATWAALSEHFDDQQLMDLVFTIGTYELLAFAMNSFGLQMDEDLKDTTPRLSD